MNIADELAKTYNDSCDIYRFENTKVNGITKNQRVLKYSGVSCALSKDSLSKVVKKDVAEINTAQTIFTRPEIDIQEGDVLLITQNGSVTPREYTAGEKFLYSGSHQEVKVSRSDKA